MSTDTAKQEQVTLDCISLNDAIVYFGDCYSILQTMESLSVNCCVTSPPYWLLRDYGIKPVAWPSVRFFPMTGLPAITIPEETCVLGLERDIWAYVGHLVLIFREVFRVLKDDGTLWLNLGDCYARAGTQAKPMGNLVPFASQSNLKAKDLTGAPWRVALALQADGWYLRRDNIWHKTNAKPESCKDRCTTCHEYVFHLAKKATYYYDHDAIKEPVASAQHAHNKVPAAWDTGRGAHGNYHKNGRGPSSRYTFSRKTATRGRPGLPDQHRPDRPAIAYGATGLKNKRSIWNVASAPYKGAHFATFPPHLIEPCIKAGCPPHGTVLDPFGGSGTTAQVANGYNRKAILCEQNPENLPLIKDRLGLGYQTDVLPEDQTQTLFA